MIVLEFGDYRVPLAPREWRDFQAVARDTAISRREPQGSDAGVAGLVLSDVDVIAVAFALEAARQRGRLEPTLVLLGKDLLDYADLASARGLASTA